jgi:diguanylate cyclase (GGDEF)-like protein/PAS domain S-box-containing protein
MTSYGPNFYKELLEHISDGVYFLDRDRRIQYWSEGAFRLTGYRAEELVGRCCPDHRMCDVEGFGGRRLCDEKCPLSASVQDGNPHEVRWFLQHKQGHRVPVVMRAQPIREANGSIVGTVAIFCDDSVQYAARRKIEEMERLAFLDPLTQLPNRRYVEMSLRTALDEFQVHCDPFGLLVIDLDRFKAINDDFGHAVGDQALQDVGKSLTSALRRSDIVGRWGGDEFAAIVHHSNREMLKGLAVRCCVSVSQTPISRITLPENDGAAVFLSVSVGGTLTLPNDTADGLFKRADALLYRCKRSGRGRALVDESPAATEMKPKRALPIPTSLRPGIKEAGRIDGTKSGS